MKGVIAICLSVFFILSTFIGMNIATGAALHEELKASYVITNVWELQNMTLDLTGDYTLANDIDAGITSTWNGGEGFIPIGSEATAFTGTLDGGNYTISGLFINRPAVNNMALLGYANGASITNLNLDNFDMTGFRYVSGLLGHNYDTLINNCDVSGTVNGNSYYVAGIVGLNHYGTITECSASGTVLNTNYYTGGIVGYNEVGGIITESHSSCNVGGTTYIGGFAGVNKGLIENCYAVGSATGNLAVGGLSGLNYNGGSVSNCYSTGSVSGTTNVGGLVGQNLSGTTHYSLWDTETSGQATSAGGTGKTTAEMMQQATFTGWDFTTVWGIDEGVSYPYLKSFQETQEDGLAARWPFDEGAGQYAYDVSGNNNTAALMPSYPGNAPAWIPDGISGTALDFDGANDYVDCGSDISLRPTSEVTISAWANIDSFNIYGSIVANCWDTMTTESGYYMCTYGSTVMFNLRTDGMGSWASVSATVGANSWHHLAATYDGVNIKLYLDGIMKSCSAVTGKIDWDPLPYGFYIGQYHDDDETYYFDGTADEVQLWSRPLDATEISDYYNDTWQNYLENESLGAHLPLDEGAGQLAEDMTGNGHNGTLGNTPGADTNDPAWVGSPWGSALSFDGVNDIIEVPFAQDPAEYTLEAWVRPTLTTSRSIILQTDASGPGISWSHQLRLDSSGRFVHYLFDGSMKAVTGTTVAVPNQWYHVVGTAVDNGAMALYVNGMAEGGTTAIGTVWKGGDRYLLGSGSGGTVSHFSGKIDEVSIWDRALKENEVLDRYTQYNNVNKSLTFTAGWNLLSFPMEQPNINGTPIRRASDLANETGLVMISRWNPITQRYMNYIPGFHMPTDPENFAIGQDDAVFAFLSADDTLEVSGYLSEGPRAVGLEPGWNLVGYHSMDEGDVEADWAWQVTCGAVDDICYWEGHTFVHYIVPGNVMALTPGRGYFVWSDAAVTLNY